LFLHLHEDTHGTTGLPKKIFNDRSLDQVNNSSVRDLFVAEILFNTNGSKTNDNNGEQAFKFSEKDIDEDRNNMVVELILKGDIQPDT